METSTDTTKQDFRERYNQLPPVLQKAIDSAEVEEHLRTLAKTHNLHIDQWQILENEVMLTLFGFEDTANLARNIQEEVGVTPEIASALAEDISKVVFAPIRSELERELDHPTATAEATTAVEEAGTQTLANEAAASKAASVAPATPPPAPPTEKAIRGSIAETYVSAPSHERKTIDGDPYREQLT